MIEQPSFHTLNLMERKLSENATTLKTPLSSISYAALIMLPLINLQYLYAPFLVHPNPGAIPAHTLGTSAHEMTNATNA